MKRQALYSLALLLINGLTLAQALWAQDADDVQQGLKAYETYQGGAIDAVSMTNGNLTLDIPVVSWPQRGKLHLGYMIISPRATFVPKTVCQIDNCTSHAIRQGGQGVSIVSDRGFYTTSTFVTETGTSVGFSYSSLVGPDGSSHILGSISSTTSETVDGTSLSYNSGYAYDADGNRYSTSSMLEDTNGNQLVQTTAGILDSVGRTIPAPPTSFGANGLGTCPSGPLPVSVKGTWVVPGPNGGSSTFTFCWAQVTVAINWDLSDGTEVTKSINFLQSLVLPNGTAWTFQYSTDFYGDLTQITFPTGGTISYVWNQAASCAGSNPLPRHVLSRTLNANDGTGNHTWTYTYALGNGFANSSGTLTVVDPLGNNTVYTDTYLSLCSNYTTQVQYYNGAANSSNLLKTVSTVYSSSVSPFAPSVGTNFMNIVPATITTTWKNGKTSCPASAGNGEGVLSLR